VIQIDRVRTNVDVVGSQTSEGPARSEPAMSAAVFDGASRERFRDFVLDVLRDHLRDLERRGVL
jgi:hypothetical protein